jgi:hypothetical protein
MKSIWPVVALVLFGGSAPLTNDTIRVQRLELVDAKGRQRIVMQVMDDGTAAVGFADKSGRMGLLLTMDDKDTPKVIVRDPNGGSNAGLVVLDGEPAFATTDASGRIRSLLRTDTKGATSLVFFNEDKEPRVKIATNGFSSSVSLKSDEDPKEGVTIFAAEKTAMVSLTSKRDGHMSEAILGVESGETRNSTLILGAGRGGVHASADQDTGAVSATLGKKRAELGFFGAPTRP